MNYKKIGFILLGILSVILVKLLFTYLTNETVIKNYKKNKYREDLINILKTTNFNEPYIVYYNEGNILYREKKYDDAIVSYQKSLTKNPPDQRKCDVYINMTITMVEMIETNKKDELLKKLQEARENLYNNHCADEEDRSGKSEEAENLEDEIREMEKQVENNDGKGNSDGDTPEESDGDQETEEEKSLENQLQETNKDANSERQKEMNEYKNLGNYQYYPGKNW